MEHAVVTFTDKKTDNIITINLQYDKDTSNLDYDVNLPDDYNPKSELDFIGFLAHMFLRTLAVNQDE